MKAPARSGPGTRPRVHKKIQKIIALQVLRGDVAPGQTFPPENELCEVHGIGRSSLREAMKVLEGKGLIRARPRAGTVVLSRSHWQILDPDLLDWSLELAPDAAFVLSLIEARQVIEPAVARLAALRADEADIAPIATAYAEMGAALEARDFTRFNEADIRFHKALLRASKNAVFEQMAQTIGAALGYAFRMTIAGSREPGSSLLLHGAVIERIRARDPEGARARMMQLLDLAVVDLGLSVIPPTHAGQPPD